MQLTKDDVAVLFKDELGECKSLDFTKFLEVRKFYKKYSEDSVLLWSEHPEILKLYFKLHDWKGDTSKVYRNWLFNYCFVEGLK